MTCSVSPDNSDETARILCTAGSWLKYRDPRRADRFTRRSSGAVEEPLSARKRIANVGSRKSMNSETYPNFTGMPVLIDS